MGTRATDKKHLQRLRRRLGDYGLSNEEIEARVIAKKAEQERRRQILHAAHTFLARVPGAGL